MFSSNHSLRSSVCTTVCKDKSYSRVLSDGSNSSPEYGCNHNLFEKRISQVLNRSHNNCIQMPGSFSDTSMAFLLTVFPTLHRQHTFSSEKIYASDIQILVTSRIHAWSNSHLPPAFPLCRCPSVSSVCCTPSLKLVALGVHVKRCIQKGA